jgi:hypothetical protein
LIAWFFVAALAASCAIPEPPPGGPEDKTAPEPIATVPVDGSAGVNPRARIEIEFSERLSGGRFDRFVEFSPEVKIAKTRWKGKRLFIEPEGALHADTTYVVRVRPGFTDAHNVKSDSGYEFAFATSAVIDTGAVSGRVYFRRKPAEKGVVSLFVLPRDSSFVPDAARPDRDAITGEDGSYRLDYLPQRSVSFILWAYNDDNANSAFDREKEAAALFADTLTLGERVSRLENVDIWIVDPREPGVVAGRVINASGLDSVPVTVTLAEERDTIPPTYWARADAGGRYKFENVLRGRYVLRAFVDLRSDSLCGTYPCPGDSVSGCVEPCAGYPDTVTVSPGDELRLKDLRLEAAARKEE